MQDGPVDFSRVGEVCCRTDGTAARERYAKYGGGLFPVAWYDLQQFWASHLPPNTLQIGSRFERYEDLGDEGVIVHLEVTIGFLK